MCWSLASAFCKSKSALQTSPQLLWQHTECRQNCAHSHVDARETLSEISSKSAVRRAGLTSFIAVLLSHHSCNHLPSLWTKGNNSGGEFPCWWRWCCGAAETSDQSQGDNERSSWRPYRTSVKRSSVGAAFLCIVLLFAYHCFNIHQTYELHSVIKTLWTNYYIGSTVSHG